MIAAGAVLAGGAVLLLLGRLALGGPRSGLLARPLALAALLAGGALLGIGHGSPAPGSEGGGEAWTRALGSLVLVSALLALLGRRRATDDRETVFAVLVLGGAAGALAVVSARDVALLVVGLEALALTTALLLGRGGRGRVLITGAVATGLSLYGLSLLYGLTGTTSLEGVSRLLVDRSGVARVGLMLLLAAPMCRLAAVPFHAWPVDAIAEADPAETGFAWAAGTIAGLAAVGRILALSGPTALVPGSLLPGPGAWPFACVATLALATLAVAGLGALRTGRLDRLVAWLAVGHGGLLLLALSIPGEAGRAGALVTLGVAVLAGQGALLGAGAQGARSPLVAGAIAALLLTLVGLPPTGGFAARVMVLGAVLDAGFPVLALVAVVLGLIPLVAVVRVLGVVLTRRPEAAPGGRLARPVATLVVLAAVAVLAAGLLWGPVARIAAAAARIG